MKENTTPHKTFLALLGSFRTSAETSISINAAKVNQKVPTSNMIPNIETCGFEERSAETKKDKTIPKAETAIQDLGKVRFPFENLAATQNINETANPITTNNPFDVSTGILLKGRKNKGKRTIVTYRDQKEIFSKTFEIIIFIILIN